MNMTEQDLGIADVPDLNSTATDIETLRFLYAMLEYLQPKVIVEAGTYRGHFAVMAARLLPDSAVLTADITQHVDLPELANLHFFKGDYGEMLKAVNNVDFAFIDSGPPIPADSKEVHCRWRHWEETKQVLVSGGIMVSHDMNALGWPGGREIAAESFMLHGGRGIGLWKKP